MTEEEETRRRMLTKKKKIAYVTDTVTEEEGTRRRMLTNAALFLGTNFVVFFWATDMSDWMAAGLCLEGV